MAFELIPLPISIVFILVFLAASLVVLWKLRKRGKVYLILLALGTVILAFVLASAVYVFTSPPNSVGNGPVRIEIISSRAYYAPSQQVHFQIFINNPHDWAVPYPTSVSYRLPPVGETVSIFGNQNLPFPAHSRTLLPTQTLWTPSQLGNYTLTVTLHGPVEYGQSANYAVEVKPAT
jgi:hypothetical protein